jgi:hypothetical protein
MDIDIESRTICNLKKARTMKPFDGRIGKRLPRQIVGDLRFFGFYVGNQTLLLKDVTDLSDIHEPSNGLGELYMIQVFGGYNADCSDVDRSGKESVRSSQIAYMKSLGTKSPFQLPLSSDEIKMGADWRHALVRFMLDLGNRKLDTAPLIDFEEDYADDVIDYGNHLEMTTAIFCNTLRMDKNFNIINENWARHRASQYLRLIKDDTYTEVPRLKNWETWLWM